MATKPTGRPRGRPRSDGFPPEPAAPLPITGKQAALEAMENLRLSTRVFRDGMSKNVAKLLGCARRR